MKRKKETKHFLISTIVHKSEERELQKQTNKREDNFTIQNQIQHFDSSEKRYKNIFNIIDQKDRKIQESYGKLKSGCKNLAVAEVERDQSLEVLLSKQTLQISSTREKYEDQLIKRK